MCLTAWNEPIGLPNWTRSLAYWTVRASTWSAAPSISALASVAARSTTEHGRLLATEEQRRRAVEGEDPELARAVHGREGLGPARAAQIDPVDAAGGQDHGDVGGGRVGDGRRPAAEAHLRGPDR